MSNDRAICTSEKMPNPITPLEGFTQRIETLSDRSSVLSNRLTLVIKRILGDVEREQGPDSSAPGNGGDGEYDNMNYAIAVLCDRIDDIESLIRIIEERF